MEKLAKKSLEKLPPYDLEAEQAVLGAILLDNNAIFKALEIFQPSDFYRPSHQKIFQAMLTLNERSDIIDLLLLRDELERRGEVDDVGGPAYLASLVDAIPTAANVEFHAKIVHEKAIARNLLNASIEIATRCYNDAEDVNSILAEAEQKIFSISEGRVKQGFTPLNEIVKQGFEKIEELSVQKSLVTGAPSGFVELDEMTSGFQPSDLIILAARPAMGKCLHKDSEIVLSDGRVQTIREIVASQQGKLLTLGADRQFHLTRPTRYVDDGVKPVFHVITRSGRTIQTTLTHPFLTLDGWKPLQQIDVGTKIAVPRRINVFGTKNIDEEKLDLLAGFICDNSRVATRPPNAVRWLKELGVWEQTAQTIHLPQRVFQLPKSGLTVFLHRLFTAGSEMLSSPEQAHISYCSESETLIRQIQHLLLRFGILSALVRTDSDKMHAQGTTVWQLIISDVQSLHTFLREIGIAGREQALSQIQNSLPAETPQVTAESDIFWDEIVSIKAQGKAQVYDLTIPETHNFVANDICVHNTSFCLNVAQNMGVRAQIPTAIFSLEMSKEQLGLRLLCAESRMDSHNVRIGNIQEDDWERLAHASEILSKAPIYIDDTPGITILEMRAKAKRLKMEKGLGAVIVDYLQLMQSKTRRENRQQEITEISRSLKILAKELHVPVIALSQLSRAVENRTDRRPQLSDLRESGAIEQDADVVMFIYRPEVYGIEGTEGLAEIIIGKQRNGPVGSVQLAFIKQYTRFENLEVHHQTSSDEGGVF